jgi:Repeat of Unknown Function (DUF347)
VKAFHPFLYWITIVATTTLGTTMADFADRSLGIGYFGGSSILFAGLIASLAVWRWSEGSISVNTVATPRVEMFYWVAILFSQTLGTALGDWMADTNGLGYEGGAVVFAAGLAVVAAAFLRENLAHLAVLGGVHSNATAWCNARGPAGQTARSRRAGDQPLCRLRHSRSDHYRSHPHSPATGGCASGSGRAEGVMQPIYARALIKNYAQSFWASQQKSGAYI